MDEDDSSTDDGYAKDKKRCYLCSEQFNTWQEVTQHQVRCKNKKKCPKCSISGSAFPLYRNFVCHTEVCNGNGSFKCPHCDKIFTNYQAVRNHKYHCSSKNVCHICNFAAKNSEAMKKHVSKYHKKFSCKMCDYHCLDNRALTCHIQVKHNTN